MADTATTSGTYRKQGLGDRTNAWGLTNGLNGVFDVLDEAIHGFDALSIATTNYSLTNTSYTTNEARQRFHRLTNGGVSANPTVTVPAVDNWWLMANAVTGLGVIVSNGSNSITLSDGETALVATDGTNVYKFGFNSVYSAPDPGSNGIVVRTASGTTVARSVAVPSAGIAITHADGVSGNPTLALADDLSALEALASTGIAARTASNTWAQRTITAPSAGIAIADGGGVSGNPTLSLANDLLALENLGTAGMAVRSAADTWTARAITGTAAEITVTDGSGVSANPTLSLPTALTFTGKTVTGGTFSAPTVTGTWTATGATCSDLGTVTTADINGGTIDGSVIGGSSAAAITGTTITASTEFRGTVLTSNAASDVALKTSGGTQFNVAHTASAEEYAQVTGAASGSPPTISAQGVSSDVQLNIAGKGASGVRVGTNLTDHLLIIGGTGTVSIGGVGGSAVVDIALNPKSTGIVTSGAAARILSGTAIPAGGTAGAGYRFTSTANFGVFPGSGAPTLSAAQGSLYLRSDGSGDTDRAYINTDGSTTWAALTTASASAVSDDDVQSAVLFSRFTSRFGG